MPSDSPEPENYSISEMMDRLKERSSGQPSNGELVTRADGSQAIRVRSRKRRSHQPKRDGEKRGRRVRAVQVVVGLLFLFLLGAMLLSVVLYMNGAGYRNKVLANIKTASGADAAVSQFRVTPLGATAGEITLAWPESSVVKRMTFQHVGAGLRFNSFLGRPWTGEEVTALTGGIQFGMPSGQTAGDVSSHEKLFNFNRFRCANTSLTFGADPQSAVMALTGSEVSLYPAGNTGQSELRINRGKARFGRDLPELELDRALVGFSGSQTNLIGMRLRAPGDSLGFLELSGPIAAVGSSQATTLDMKVDGVGMEYLAGVELGRILSGRIDSREVPNTNFLSFTPGSPASHRLELAFQGGAGSRLGLAELPFLTRLSLLLDDKGYKMAVLDAGASGMLRLGAGGISLDDLKLDVRSRMSIRGNLAIAQDKTLSGKLEVGLPALVVTSDRRLDAAFGPVKSDMRWIELTVSGTAAIPADDFEKRVIAGEGSRSRPSAKSAPTGTSPADDFFNLTPAR